MHRNDRRFSPLWRHDWLAAAGTILFLSVAALFPPSEARATSYLFRTTGEAAQLATRVVWVRCLSVEVKEGVGGGIWTYWEFDVLRIVKGHLPKDQFTLRFLGGRIGDRIVDRPDMPTFKPGDEAVLFLGADGSSGLPTLGLFFGVATNPDNEERFVVSGLHGAPPFHPNSLPLFHAVDGTAYATKPAAVPLEDFLYSLEQIVSD